MFIFLPFFFFLALVILLKRYNSSWREAILLSLICCGAVIFLSTEILSLFRLFSFKPLCLVWAVGLIVAIVLNVVGRKGTFRLDLPDIRTFFVVEKILLGFMAAEALLLGALAVYVPPGTWDAMTYHMSRVAHWIQNGTVAFYPTGIQRQLLINPFAEYWVAHFQILSGADYFANAVQWLGMLGSIVAISLIARALGAGRLGQILSAFFVLTLPNAIIEATSTQTDFVATLWTVTALYFMLKNIQQLRAENFWAMGAAAFLAFYTKGSVMFILLPFLCWSSTLMARRNVAPLKVAGHAALGLAVFLVAIGILFLKNDLAFRYLVYPGEKGHILAWYDFKGIFSNLLLHYGMHLRVGVLPIDNVLGGVIEQIHRWMGMTITTSQANLGQLAFNYLDFPFYEDEIPNFLFSVSAIIAAVFFLRKREFSTLKGGFFLMAFLCLFIFNAFVKWSPFDGRYHLPFFVLLAPLLADVFAVRGRRLTAIIVLFSILTTPFIFFNASKPFVTGPFKLFYKKEPVYGSTSILKISRQYQYFYNHPGIAMSFMITVQTAMESGCKDIGLALTEDTWEYPFWIYLHMNGRPVRIEHVLVPNPSKDLPYPLGDFSPCAVISDSAFHDETLYIAGKFYPRVRTTPDFNLYYSTPLL